METERLSASSSWHFQASRRPAGRSSRVAPTERRIQACSQELSWCDTELFVDLNEIRKEAQSQDLNGSDNGRTIRQAGELILHFAAKLTW